MVSDLVQVERASGRLQDKLKIVLQYVDDVLVNTDFMNNFILYVYLMNNLCFMELQGGGILSCPSSLEILC